MKTYFNRRYGIEFEVCGPSPSQARTLLRKNGLSAWDADDDGSITDDRDFSSFSDETEFLFHIDSAEIKSPILKPNIESLASVNKVAQILQQQGFYSNYSCGLHVHIEFEKESLNNMLATLYCYGLLEDTLFDKINVSHRRKSISSYCKRVDTKEIEKKVITKLNHSIVPYCERHEICSNIIGSRNHKVNTRALRDHGTIEFRQFAGTLNGIDVCNWVSLLQYFVSFVCHYTNKDNFKKELELISKLNPEQSYYIPETIINRCGSKLKEFYDNLLFINHKIEINRKNAILDVNEINELNGKALPFFQKLGFNSITKESFNNFFLLSLKKDLPFIYAWVRERSLGSMLDINDYRKIS